MKIGITGTRSGMTVPQEKNIREFFDSLEGVGCEFHHGDCVGVDVDVAQIANDYQFRTICHPPIKDDLRGWHESNEVRESFSYFKRNRNIVDETDILMVVPFQSEWQSNSGTWSTHDYANKHNKDIVIFFPDGQVWEKVRKKLF